MSTHQIQLTSHLHLPPLSPATTLPPLLPRSVPRHHPRAPPEVRRSRHQVWRAEWRTAGKPLQQEPLTSRSQPQAPACPRTLHAARSSRIYPPNTSPAHFHPPRPRHHAPPQSIDHRRPPGLLISLIHRRFARTPTSRAEHTHLHETAAPPHPTACHFTHSAALAAAPPHRHSATNRDETQTHTTHQHHDHTKHTRIRRRVIVQL